MGREPDSLAKGEGRLSRVARLPLCRDESDDFDDDGLWAARPWEVVAAAAGEDVIISEASRFWRTVDDIQGMELRIALVGGYRSCLRAVALASRDVGCWGCLGGWMVLAALLLW
mmetsp:Transcript_25105/g.52876  ORF Transcript_25105/g.52876 Transcript_25105/m.52876 type:complete len:114 (-) Transcript_25105:104-445(-)